MSKQPALTSEEYNRVSKVEENFVVLKKYQDHRFGPVSIIQVPGNQKKLMVREKTFGSKGELTTEIYAAKKRIGINDPHLLALVDYSTGERSDFCASFYWIKLFFEFPDHDIDQEIRRRAKFNLVGFNSSELTHMLYNVVQGGAALNKVGLYHGDICPQTIEMDNPSSYKLVERFGDLAKPEDFQHSRIIKGGDSYAAPELYARFKLPSKIKEQAPNMATADVFSLGMTLLRAGTDNPIQGVYAANGSIDFQRLDQLKRNFVARFPENNLLVSTVCAMLEADPKLRPRDFVSMEQELPPYAVVQQTLAQGGSGFVQEGPSGQAYNQYVSQAEWEHHWINQQQPQRPTGNSIMSSHLNIAHPVQQPVQQVPPQQQQPQLQTQPQVQQPQQVAAHHFGVVPQLGQGVQSFAPQPLQYQTSQVQVSQPGAGLQQGIPASTVVSGAGTQVRAIQQLPASSGYVYNQAGQPVQVSTFSVAGNQQPVVYRAH